MERKTTLPLALMSLLWLFVVIAGYFVAHKPFTAANLRALGEAAAGAGGALLVVGLGTGIGLALLRRCDLLPVERLTWAMALGLGGVALTALALGALGLLRPWLLWLLTVVGLLVTARPLGRALRAAWADPTWRPQTRFERLLAGYCGLTLAVALAWALAPPTAWDGLVYHLTGPRLYLEAGRISHPLDLPYLGFPQLVEMLFAWGMGLAGERAAAPIHWGYGLATVPILVTAGRRWPGGSTGWLAAAILLSAPSITLLAGWPYVDLALLLYTTLAFLALTRSWEGSSPARRWLLLSGVCAGLALSTKYTALALLPALGLTLLLQRLAASDTCSALRITHHATRDMLILCGIAFLVWLPWLLKNFLLTGNPTYPFFFGGIYWDDWRAWWYDRAGTGLAATAPWRLLTAPWEATVWGMEGGTGYSATIGPLFLALLPLLLAVWRQFAPLQRRRLGAALACCAVLYGFWLWGVARSALLQQTRLLVPAFGLLALLVAAAVEGLRTLPTRPLNVDWLMRAVIALVLLLNLVGMGLDWVYEGPQRVLLGYESRDEYLARRLGWYHVAMEGLDRALPPDAVVLFLWEPRAYPCRVECWPDALLDRWLHETHRHGPDGESIAADWRAQGVTHVLLFRVGYQAVAAGGFDPLSPADAQALETLLAHLQPVANWDGVYELYALGR